MQYHYFFAFFILYMPHYSSAMDKAAEQISFKIHEKSHEPLEMTEVYEGTQYATDLARQYLQSGDKDRQKEATDYLKRRDLPLSNENKEK